MAQVTTLWQYGGPGLVRTFSAKPAAAVVVWTSFGRFLYTTENYDVSVGHYLEAYMRATSDTCYARLWDVTAASAVSGSEITETGATLARNRSGALTLTDGNEYDAQAGSLASTGRVKNLHLVHY